MLHARGHFPLAIPLGMCDGPVMLSIRKRMEAVPIHQEAPEGFSLSEVQTS